MQQELKADGFEVTTVSVDRVDSKTHQQNQYAYFKTTMTDMRLDVYRKCDFLTEEVLGLERLSDGHIEHPDAGKSGCFTGDTKVSLVDGRELTFLELVDEFNSGKDNYVYSFNLDANSLELKKVTNSIISQTLETYIMTIGNKTFEVTPRHQLYIIDKSWTRAYDVKIGDKMLDANGKEIIINNIVNKKYSTPIKTYNLTIDGNNNYFVTDIQVLVHNVGSDTWYYDDTELLN